MEKYLIISTTNDLVRIAPERIVYISSDGNYSTLIQADGETRLWWKISKTTLTDGQPLAPACLSAAPEDIMPLRG